MAPATTTTTMTTKTNLSANLCRCPPSHHAPRHDRTKALVVVVVVVVAKCWQLAPVPARDAIDLSINRQIAWIWKLIAGRITVPTAGRACGRSVAVGSSRLRLSISRAYVVH